MRTAETRAHHTESGAAGAGWGAAGTPGVAGAGTTRGSRSTEQPGSFLQRNHARCATGQSYFFLLTAKEKSSILKNGFCNEYLGPRFLMKN